MLILHGAHPHYDGTQHALILLLLGPLAFHRAVFLAPRPSSGGSCWRRRRNACSRETCWRWTWHGRAPASAGSSSSSIAPSAPVQGSCSPTLPLGPPHPLPPPEPASACRPSARPASSSRCRCGLCNNSNNSCNSPACTSTNPAASPSRPAIKRAVTTPTAPRRPCCS